MNECVKEDPLEDDDGVPQASDGAKKKKRTKRKEDNLGMRWVGFMYLTLKVEASTLWLI